MYKGLVKLGIDISGFILILKYIRLVRTSFKMADVARNKFIQKHIKWTKTALFEVRFGSVFNGKELSNICIHVFGFLSISHFRCLRIKVYILNQANKQTKTKQSNNKKRKEKNSKKNLL